MKMVLCVCVCFLQKYPSPSVQDSANRSGGEEEEEEEEVHRVNLFICNPLQLSFLTPCRFEFYLSSYSSPCRRWEEEEREEGCSLCFTE